ncbi:hypothetical protein HJ590_17695 [Naumannella sp. ID2617S]|nr:hypothetical protein [Naumannella sp. ID2617S]
MPNKLPDLAALQDELAAALGELSALSGMLPSGTLSPESRGETRAEWTGRSDDGLFEVTVSASGRLESVRVDSHWTAERAPAVPALQQAAGRAACARLGIDPDTTPTAYAPAEPASADQVADVVARQQGLVETFRLASPQEQQGRLEAATARLDEAQTRLGQRSATSAGSEGPDELTLRTRSRKAALTFTPDGVLLAADFDAAWEQGVSPVGLMTALNEILEQLREAVPETAAEDDPMAELNEAFAEMRSMMRQLGVPDPGKATNTRPEGK